MSAAKALRSTMGLALRPAPRLFSAGNAAFGDTRAVRTMQSGGGQRGYSSSSAGEWEWMDACFAGPAAAGMAVYGYHVWVLPAKKRRSRVRMEEQQMI